MTARPLGGRWLLHALALLSPTFVLFVGGPALILALTAKRSDADTVTYQKGDGKGSVSESDDATVDETVPTTNFSSLATCQVDQSAHQHCLLKFPNIFGSGVNQIPLGSTILNATLTLYVANNGDPANCPVVYQLVEPWTESQATWNERSTGVGWTNPGADGTASHKPVAAGIIGCDPIGFYNLGVTTSVQNWSNGEANEGWVFIEGASNNGIDFTSSEEVTNPNRRPQLSVTYLPETPCARGNALWWNADWGRRRKVKFDNSGQAQSLDNFPVLIRLDTLRIDYTRTQNLGQDIRFVDQDNNTVLAHEIELWNEAGSSYVWVRVPRIDGASRADFIWIYYDNAVVADGQNPTGVWDANHRAVWHLKENPAAAPPQFLDSTANPNDGTVAATPPLQVAGQIHFGLGFTAGTDRHVAVSDHASLQLSTSMTVSAWVNTTSADAQNRVIVARWGTSPNRNYWLGKTGGATLRFFVDDTQSVTAPLGLINDGAWHHVVGVADAPSGLLRIYVDGVQRNTAAYTGTSRTGVTPLFIGANPAAALQDWDGSIDETRVEIAARSADWVRAQYLSMTDSFASFTAELGSCNVRSIGTRADYGTLAPEGTGTTASVTQGSLVVSGSGTAWLASNRGRGDRININGVDYTIFSVNSNTSLQLTSSYRGATASGLTYSMSRQYTTLASWEDCIDGPPGAACPFFPVTSTSLVVDNRSEVGIAYKDSVFVLASAFVIDGSTTDTLHTITLTVDPANRHNGVQGVGVVVDGLGAPNPIRVQDSNVTIEWLEVKSVRGSNGVGVIQAVSPIDGVVLQDLLIHDYFDGSGNDISGVRLSGVGGSSVTIRNCMIWEGDRYGIQGDELTDTLTVENVSIDNVRDALAQGIFAAASTVTVRNTIVTRSTLVDFAAGTGSLSGSNNTSSDLTAPGASPQTSVTAASLFVAPGSDLHLKAGAVAVDSGLDLSSSFVNDIDGQSRFGLLWDRGADELGAPAAADLAVAKDDGQATEVPGTAISYTITVTNNGPDTLGSLFVNDAVSAQITGAIFTPSTGAYNGVTGEWTGLSLATTQNATLILSGTIDPFARGSLVNAATVSPPPGVTDPNGTNDSASDTDTLDPSADVEIVKTDAPDPAPLGGLLTYTLTVTNNGPSGATNVDVSDVLPVDMELDGVPAVAITPSQGSCNYTAATRVVSCNLGNLGPTLVATVVIKVRPQAQRSFLNTASVTRFETDPAPVNNSESETTLVEISSLGVRFFTATSTNERNVLEWVNPTDANYLSTEIVVRGGQFPTGPGDGATIYLSGAGGSGGRVKLPHATGALSNGQIFYYGAFVHRGVAPVLSPGRFVTGRPFDHTTGPVKWAFATGATALAAPTVGGAGVIATSNDRVVYAMERGIDDDQIGVDSGEWPASFRPLELGGPVQLRSPVVPVTVGTANPVAYFGAQDGKVYVVDATQGGAGSLPWSSTMVGPMVQAAPAGIFTAFSGAFNHLVVGTRDSTNPNAFVAVNPFTGMLVDSFNNGGAGPGAIGIVNGMAVVDYLPLPLRAYFTSYENPAGSTNTLWAFNLAASPTVFNPIWAKQLGNIDSSPVLRGGRVLVGSPQGGGTIHSFEALLGGDERTFFHNDGQVRGFIFPDRASATGDIYFATDDFVWGLTEMAGALAQKFTGPIALPGGAKPSTVLFFPGRDLLYVGGSDGKLYELDTLQATPMPNPVTLGDGLAVVGAPSLDRDYDLVHVGTEAGIFYAVQVPLP